MVLTKFEDIAIMDAGNGILQSVGNVQVSIFEPGTTNLLAQQLYSDPDGEDELDNPFFAEDDGSFKFYVNSAQTINIELDATAQDMGVRTIEYQSMVPNLQSTGLLLGDATTRIALNGSIGASDDGIEIDQVVQGVPEDLIGGATEYHYWRGTTIQGRWQSDEQDVYDGYGALILNPYGRPVLIGTTNMDAAANQSLHLDMTLHELPPNGSPSHILGDFDFQTSLDHADSGAIRAVARLIANPDTLDLPTEARVRAGEFHAEHFPGGSNDSGAAVLEIGIHTQVEQDASKVGKDWGVWISSTRGAYAAIWPEGVRAGVGLFLTGDSGFRRGIHYEEPNDITIDPEDQIYTTKFAIDYHGHMGVNTDPHDDYIIHAIEPNTVADGSPAYVVVEHQDPTNAQSHAAFWAIANDPEASSYFRMTKGGVGDAYIGMDGADDSAIVMGVGARPGLDNAVRIDRLRTVYLGDPSLDTTDTSGHLAIPSTAGTPTGVPVGFAEFPNMAFLAWNRTAHTLHAYDGAWRTV